MQRLDRRAKGPTNTDAGALGRQVRHIDGGPDLREARGAGGGTRPKRSGSQMGGETKWIGADSP